jgi:PPM family protein phosphatase
MKVVAGVATDIGQVREGNEDAYLVEPPLYAVADGMGGAKGGEVASQLALETIEERFRAGTGTLESQLEEANRTVFEKAAGDQRLRGMGTTLTAALIAGGAAHLAHVGDSRAYLSRAGALRMLTRDHTLVNQMVAEGEISEAEAEVHPHRNVLTRVIGTEPEVDVDVDDVGLLEGDRLLLCSDGLTTMLTKDQIKAILESGGSPQEAADRLVRAANRAGGLDNITVLILDVLSDDDPKAETGMDIPTASPAARASAPTTSVDDTSRRVKRAGISIAIALVVLVVGYTALRSWLDSQWYVGISEGKVAIFQGIPAELLGFELSSVATTTAIDADDALAIPTHENLEEGVNRDSLEDAEALVDQIEHDIRVAERSSS